MYPMTGEVLSMITGYIFCNGTPRPLMAVSMMILHPVFLLVLDSFWYFVYHVHEAFTRSFFVTHANNFFPAFAGVRMGWKSTRESMKSKALWSRGSDAAATLSHISATLEGSGPIPPLRRIRWYDEMSAYEPTWMSR